jgi:LysR family transcriptional activator of nhaA
MVLSYADEIFSAGRELMNAVKQCPSKRAMRVNIGITDALSKLITFEILKAAFRHADPIHVTCREGEIGPLVQQLQAHRLDIVLADEPASRHPQDKDI